jgi:hypothetical protein
VRLTPTCYLCWRTGTTGKRRFIRRHGVLLHTGACAMGYGISLSLEHFNCRCDECRDRWEATQPKQGALALTTIEQEDR